MPAREPPKLTQPATTRTAAGTRPRMTRRRTRVSLALGAVLAFAVDGGPQAPSDARAEFGAHFAGRLDSERLDAGKLLLSEVVSNCVQHGAAGGAGIWINVTAANTAHVLHVEVSDDGPVFSYASRRPLAGDTAGTGLSIVEALSNRWGIDEHDRARVWFELETPETDVDRYQPAVAAVHERVVERRTTTWRSGMSR